MKAKKPKIQKQKTEKQSYRIRNWKDYNAALVARGNLMTFWFDENVVKVWANEVKTGQRGRSRIYTDMAIQCVLTLKAVFHLPLRATEGLWLSLVKLMRQDDPDSRLQHVVPPTKAAGGKGKPLPTTQPGAIHVVVDSTAHRFFANLRIGRKHG